MPPPEHYDLIVVGTGFASMFFLKGWLSRAPEGARALVLERGPHRTHPHQLQDRNAVRQQALKSFHNATPDKLWRFALGLGGGSQCWWACTPRHMPEDFALASTYGAGTDWPLTYDDLEPWYVAVEWAMGVAGAQERTPFPMSRPYPQPPHGLSDPDRALLAAEPERFFPQPTARPTRATEHRPACCGNGVCSVCPIDSKFTIQNEMMGLLRDPRVRLLVGAVVDEVEVADGVAKGVRYRRRGTDARASADLVALGCNAIFNAWILLRSGLDDGVVGRGLCEQRSVMVSVDLADLDGYQGTTSITGHGYHFASGDHRRRVSGALVETLNMPLLNDVRGKWLRRWNLKFIFGDLPDDRSVVEVDPDDPSRPRVRAAGPSSRLTRAVREVDDQVDELLAPLRVERVRVGRRLGTTEAHLLCTHRMGVDPATSVTDGGLVHHRLRNLLVLGGGSFPTAPPANPTLTLSALSLRAAALLWS